MLPAAIVAGCPCWRGSSSITDASHVLLVGAWLSPLRYCWALPPIVDVLGPRVPAGRNSVRYVPVFTYRCIYRLRRNDSCRIIFPRTETPYLRLEKAILILSSCPSLGVVPASACWDSFSMPAGRS